MNGKNKIIGTIIVVLILIGAFLWWKGTRDAIVTGEDGASVVETRANTRTSPTLAEAAYTQTRVKENGVYVTTVQYTPEGFVPAIIYINHGESVRFINKTEGAMRVATNEFQNVPLYSGFGQTKTVGAGGEYEFLFNERGVWGYNNLNSNPKVYGIVYVR